jgi:hypothetical protein
MKFAKRLLMVAGAVALVGLFSVLLAPKAVHAVVSTLVTVSNTTSQPVPTIAVDTRNVNVVNTPNVNVTNTVPVTGTVAVSGTPTVQLNGSVNAMVTNAPDTAVPVMQAPGASLLYESTCSGTYVIGAASCSFASIPTGYTLFIESASIISNQAAGPSVPQFGELYFPPASPPYVNQPSHTVSFYIPMVQQGSESTVFVVNGFVNYVGTFSGRAWAGPGANAPGCSVVLNDTSTGGNYPDVGGIGCSIFGYLASQ